MQDAVAVNGCLKIVVQIVDSDVVAVAVSFFQQFPTETWYLKTDMELPVTFP